MTKMNKMMAGYHMLMILSKVDGDFSEAEGEVIGSYLKERFSSKTDLDKELEVLSGLPRQDYFLHFNNSMNDFYEDSTENERIEFLKFAVNLATADNKVTVEENKYLKELFFAWDSQYEE